MTVRDRAALAHLRWLLIVLLSGAILPISDSVAQSTATASSFDVQISLSQKAQAKLESLSEGIVIAATYSANPASDREPHANQIGQIDLGHETVEISGRPQFVHIAGPHFAKSLLAETRGPVLLNVNVYSARRSGPDNILNCDFFDGNLQQAVREPLTLHCSLIAERAGSNYKGGIEPIPASRAADSYAIYSLLTPGAPDDTITPSQVQQWAIAGTTVNITDMNPAVPPDGQLKPPPDNPEAFNQALRDFNSRKYERFRLDAAGFHPSLAFSLIDQQQVKDRRQSASGTSGIAFFSAVYFNNNQTAALVYVNLWCANLCSAGQWVYLEKHSGRWIRRSGLVSSGA